MILSEERWMDGLQLVALLGCNASVPDRGSVLHCTCGSVIKVMKTAIVPLKIIMCDPRKHLGAFQPLMQLHLNMFNKNSSI